jgi:hypothetical protein
MALLALSQVGRRQLLVGLATGMAAVLLSGLEAAPVRSAPVGTQAVYAAFTLNLTRFVIWPETAFADAQAPLVIGTFPRDPINEHLDPAAEKEAAHERPIRTIRIQSLDDVSRCHVIFVPKNHPRAASVLERARGRPILTVGDADGFLDLGGHVRFVPQPSHTTLRVSVENLKASGLIGRSQLLRLASR